MLFWSTILLFSGRFHILSDFDEGKRSCRRKLERHNNRRRRKSTDPKGLTEIDAQPLLSAEDAGCDDVTVGGSNLVNGSTHWFFFTELDRK